jgi:hypothetical protein
VLPGNAASRGGDALTPVDALTVKSHGQEGDAFIAGVAATL